MPTQKRRSLSIPRADSDPFDPRAARAAALAALSRRDHSSHELRHKLIAKGYEAALVDELLERLRADRLLDDRRYLESFVAYHAGRGQGPHRIRSDLLKSGMQPAQADAALEAYPDWGAQLKRAREKKFGTSPPTNYADGQRQARFLAYRGFTSAQIRAALGVDTDLNVDL